MAQPKILAVLSRKVVSLITFLILYNNLAVGAEMKDQRSAGAVRRFRKNAQSIARENEEERIKKVREEFLEFKVRSRNLFVACVVGMGAVCATSDCLLQCCCCACATCAYAKHHEASTLYDWTKPSAKFPLKHHRMVDEEDS